MTTILDEAALEQALSVAADVHGGYMNVTKVRATKAAIRAYLSALATPSTGAVGWPHADDEAIRRSLEAQREQLINLPKNWDGYGAGPLMPSIVDIMLGDIETEGCLAQLVPGSDGSLQAEWHLPGVTVEYDITVDGKRHLYVVLKPAAPPSSPSERDAALDEAEQAAQVVLDQVSARRNGAGFREDASFSYAQGKLIEVVKAIRRLKASRSDTVGPEAAALSSSEHI
jgi:hypothetical protein